MLFGKTKRGILQKNSKILLVKSKWLFTNRTMMKLFFFLIAFVTFVWLTTAIVSSFAYAYDGLFPLPQVALGCLVGVILPIVALFVAWWRKKKSPVVLSVSNYSSVQKSLIADQSIMICVASSVCLLFLTFVPLTVLPSGAGNNVFIYISIMAFIGFIVNFWSLWRLYTPLFGHRVKSVV